MPSKKTRDLQTKKAKRIFFAQCDFLTALEQRGIQFSSDVLFEALEKIRICYDQPEKIEFIHRRYISSNATRRQAEQEVASNAIQEAAATSLSAIQEIQYIFDMEYRDGGDDGEMLDLLPVQNRKISTMNDGKKEEEKEEEGLNRESVVPLKVESASVDLFTLRSDETIYTREAIRKIVNMERLPSEVLESTIKLLETTDWGERSTFQSMASIECVLRVSISRFLSRFASALKTDIKSYRQFTQHARQIVGSMSQASSPSTRDTGSWHWFFDLKASSIPSALDAQRRLLQHVVICDEDNAREDFASRDSKRITPGDDGNASNRRAEKGGVTHVKRIAQLLLWGTCRVRLMRALKFCRGTINALADDVGLEEDSSPDAKKSGTTKSNLFHTMYSSLSLTLTELRIEAKELLESLNVSAATFQDLTSRMIARLLEKNVEAASLVACQANTMIRLLELRTYYAMRRAQAFKVVIMRVLGETPDIFSSSFELVKTPRDGYFVVPRAAVKKILGGESQAISNRYICPGFVDIWAQDSLSKASAAMDQRWCVVKNGSQIVRRIEDRDLEESLANPLHIIFRRAGGQDTYTATVLSGMPSGLFGPVGENEKSGRLKAHLLECIQTFENDRCGNGGGGSSINSSEGCQKHVVFSFWRRLASRLVRHCTPRQILLTTENFFSSIPRRESATLSTKKKNRRGRVRLVSHASTEKVLKRIAPAFLCAHLERIRGRVATAERCCFALFSRAAKDPQLSICPPPTDASKECTGARSATSEHFARRMSAAEKHKFDITVARNRRDAELLKFEYWEKRKSIALNAFNQTSEILEREKRSVGKSREVSNDATGEGSDTKGRDPVREREAIFKRTRGTFA